MKHISEIVDGILADVVSKKPRQVSKKQRQIPEAARIAGLSAEEYRESMDEAHEHFRRCDLMQEQAAESHAKFDLERSGGR